MTADAVGGIWFYALDLARGLGAHGVETVLMVLGPTPAADQEAAAAAVPGLRLQTSSLPLDWLAEGPRAVHAAGCAVARMAVECDASLVHLNSPALAAGVQFPVPVVGACHSCVATWWKTMRRGPMPAEFAWRSDLVSHGYAAAAALVAPSAAFAAATAETYRLPTRPLTVHNGRHATATAASGDAAVAFAFTAGRLWDEGKNLMALDRAAARLSLPVLAAGPTEGPNGARVDLLHLKTLGQLSGAAVAAWLRRRPVFVSVARYEPFGLAVLEAAQAGCALVLSDIPSFRELWDGAAEFVPPEDEVAVADAIRRMLCERERRARFGVAARERARRYSVEAMAAGVFGIYRRVLRNAVAPAGREVVA
ncbi:MAG: glycosyltransferase family 4 protein [Acetobacteraceae bacterium]|nr:glycosyltransferase family 4 protein [Acetobacteraceae bacterium]